VKPIVLRPVVTDTLAVLLVLGAALAVILHTFGCGPDAEPAAYGITVKVSYDALLRECIERGKDAGSYAVYETCADALDRHYCMSKGLRCNDGGR